ncbi:toxin YdaT family protein [Citrobacter portucalensis]|uniref:toxin YdaT family protein n=1 Tax=Citrobacter portucalensis TaxID=1639133 RepID=UPI0018A3A794|nr:toxin YdaT family protein [Citrobacter portucalensis]BBV41355.1 hypothetical protein STW0522CIT26_28270 [Citrobacter portucalensis]BBV46336.1 hypothetical protein STW0522CIT27_27760 [Citrobacter portucalensis]BBV51618.1 hypothetical protein STW0522CIT30_28780 [Citrobacter portucalensis]BBW12350.1 hypothetical protein STN0717CIT27_28260 [Citrobacter portucalensis]BBW17402.1 hypothetical protein STN0717CIT36_28260 [Citrobacter portucalensis]
MKISPPLSEVAAAVELWAAAVGWKTVAGLVAGEYHANGCGELLAVADSETGLRNAAQKLKRVFRGYDGPRYANQAEILKPFILVAMPAEMRARLVLPRNPILLAALAAKEGIEAVNAVNLGAAPASLLKECDEAIAAFMNLKKSLSFTELGLCA